MAQLTQSMETRCIGRYLVDLPSSFQPYIPDLTLYYGKTADFHTVDVQIVDHEATPESFEVFVTKRDAELGGVVNAQTGKSNLLERTKEPNDGVMFTSYKNSGAAMARAHELHLLVGKAHVVIKASSYEGVSDAAQDMSPAVQARMLKLAKEIHPVVDPEKAGPGFCLGSIIVNSNEDYEQANFYFRQKRGKFKNVDFDVSVSTFQERDPSTPDLIHRGDKLMSLMTSTKILRKGTLVVGGRPAEEVLTTNKVGDGDSQLFVAETNSPSPGLTAPRLHFEFKLGRADGGTADSPSPLSDSEAVGLWDAVMKSVRPRPGAS